MGALSYIPTPQAVEAAWESYVELVRQANADTRLWECREHVEQVARAKKQFDDAFLALERAA